MRQIYPVGSPTGLRTARGFSLLEALVAMAIASVSFAALYQTVGQSAKNASDVDDRVQAAMLARSILASATFAEDLLAQPSGESGAWRWQVQLAPTEVPLQSLGADPQPLPPLPAAGVTIHITRAGRSVLHWSTWKPYGAAP